MTKEAIAMISKHGGGYYAQRAILKHAKQNGWPSKEPSVLGTYDGDQAVEWAVDFVRSLPRSKQLAGVPAS